MAGLTKPTIEQATPIWLKSFGHSIKCNPEIAPNLPFARGFKGASR